MTLSPRVVTVATTPTLLSMPQADAMPGASLAVKVPTGGQTVFIGGVDVTAAGAGQGWPLAAGESLYLDLNDAQVGVLAATETVYGIVAATTQAVNVLSSGV